MGIRRMWRVVTSWFARSRVCWPFDEVGRVGPRKQKTRKVLGRIAMKRPTRNFTEFFTHVKGLGFNPGTVIDVGVARGTPQLYEAFPDAHILLFEPVKGFEECLQKITKKYNAEYQICALGSSDSQSTILKTEQLHGSSMMHRVEDQQDPRLQAVDVRTLDSFTVGRDLEGPYLLKTDCQGGDFEVIKGALNTLERCEIVIMEVSLFQFWGGHHPKPLEILQFMDDHGFVIYDFLDGLFRPLDNALGQLDIVFVKKDGMFRQSHKWG